jgi:MoaA/NifB/PqqE/SkfB family radical SAM enzyme
MLSKILGYSLTREIRSGLLHLLQLSNYALPPSRLHIDIAHECNLNCFMCPHKQMETENKYLPIERFKRILDQFPRVKAVTLQGCGETLLNPDLAEMLTLDQSRNIDFTVVTNGTLLNERNINKLKNVSSITVSIDSAIPEKYKQIRGAKLEVVINNLKRLKQLKPDVRLSIQAIIMKETIESMPQLIDLAHNVGADEVRLLNLEGFNPELEKKHAHKLDNVLNILEKTKKVARERKIRLEIPPLQPTLRDCFEPWFSPRISLEGNIYPCCYIYVSSEETWKEWFQGANLDVPQYQYKMGNIFEQSFKEIWNGDNYKLLRKTIRKSGKHITLAPEKLNDRRQALDLSKSFSYCNVCLYRWNCHC